MKTGGASIVIAQTHAELLSVIRAVRNPSGPNLVIYTSNPGDVIQEALAHPVDVVITGALYYRCTLKSIKKKLDLLDLAELEGPRVIDDYYLPPRSGPRKGVELAEQLRWINPHILVLRFTVLPEDDPGGIAGDIPKDGLDVLLEFIDAPRLRQMLRTKDCAGLARTFPRILFYPALDLWARGAMSAHEFHGLTWLSDQGGSTVYPEPSFGSLTRSTGAAAYAPPARKLWRPAWSPSQN